jgi:hypothetical protein
MHSPLKTLKAEECECCGRTGGQNHPAAAMVNDGVNVTANNSTMPLTHCEKGGAANASLGIGIFLGTLGSVLINIGQNLQSTGMMGRPDVQKKPCTSRTWVIGMTTFAVGAVINFLAFAFAPASILVPIEASQFVVNVIWGKFVNKKNISMRMLAGVTLTIIGTLMCVIFGPSANRCFSMSSAPGFDVTASRYNPRPSHARNGSIESNPRNGFSVTASAPIASKAACA